jgi:hypothetical protein
MSSSYSKESPHLPDELFGVIMTQLNEYRRNNADFDHFSPQITELDELEVEKLEQTQERESRYIRFTFVEDQILILLFKGDFVDKIAARRFKKYGR